MSATAAAAPLNGVAQSASPIRPPLKWAGGKRWQVPLLVPHWQPHSHRRLVEPFAGGLAVALGLRPKKALLNDVNPHLINFYCWLKRGLIVEEIFENEERSFYQNRERFNRLILAGKSDTSEAAGLFYYLNRTGYNGLCRFNQSGEFNVPFGRYKSIGYKYDFSEYKLAFAGWEFSNLSFRDLRLKSTDFVYADPPYDVEFTTYSSGGFGWEDQEATASWLGEHSGPVVLSNQATPRVLALYRKLAYKTPTHEAPRRISCTGDRSPALEVLATRNL